MNVTLEEYQFMLDDNNLSEKRKLSKVDHMTQNLPNS